MHAISPVTDPAAALAALRAAHAAGAPAPLHPFFGHRARPGAGAGAWALSQWWPAAFTVDGVRYAHAEGYMMAAKARLFGDEAALAAILAAADPRRAKELGRAVRGFDQRTWDAHAYPAVLTGTVAKFAQHPDLAAYLRSTAPAVLVEASPYDRVWGVGLAATDPRVGDPRTWRGRNLLGFALTEARDHHL